MGSKSAPSRGGRIGAVLARSAAALYGPSWHRLELFVDGPLVHRCAATLFRAHCTMAAALLLRAALSAPIS